MVLSRVIERIGEMPVVKFWVRFSAAGPAVLAGAIAYNIIFALVPGAVVLLTAASFFGKTAEAQAETIRIISLIAPVEVAEFIGSALGDTSRIVDNREGVVIILGAVLALWFGTRGVLTIMRVLTRVEGIEDDRPWWVTRLIATGLTIAVGLALALASVLIVAGRAIRDWLQEITQLAWPIDLWAALRIPVASLSVLVFFWLLYRFAPPRRLPGTWLAAVMATVGHGRVLPRFAVLRELCRRPRSNVCNHWNGRFAAPLAVRRFVFDHRRRIGSSSDGPAPPTAAVRRPDGYHRTHETRTRNARTRGCHLPDGPTPGDGDVARSRGTVRSAVAGQNAPPIPA